MSTITHTLPTDAQREARNRSWRIFRLRGLWSNVGFVGGERGQALRYLIDAELVDMGAESESSRVRKQRAKIWGEDA